MPTLRKMPSGRWQMVVRRKGTIISQTFARLDDARRWGSEMDQLLDSGKTPVGKRSAPTTTFSDLINIHLDDQQLVGKACGRNKLDTLERLRRQLGTVGIYKLDRNCLVEFGRKRAAEGAGPSTLSQDFGAIRLILAHAAAVHGVAMNTAQVDMARLALKRLGLIGNGVERDRRPTEEELSRLLAYMDSRRNGTMPLGRAVKFAVATAMRLDEIFRVTWNDFDEKEKMLTVRDRKDPRQKRGNDQRIPLLDVSGYDAVALIMEQAALRFSPDSRIFPYHARSAGMGFYRACLDLGIEDLHFHDLRHEATSRLFEAGYPIEQVALVTGHKDWKMLRRYTHLKPESLHNFAALRRSASEPEREKVSA